MLRVDLQFFIWEKCLFDLRQKNYTGPDAPDPAPNGALIYFHLGDSQTNLRLSILDPWGKPRLVYANPP